MHGAFQNRSKHGARAERNNCAPLSQPTHQHKQASQAFAPRTSGRWSTPQRGRSARPARAPPRTPRHTTGTSRLGGWVGFGGRGRGCCTSLLSGVGSGGAGASMTSRPAAPTGVVGVLQQVGAGGGGVLRGVWRVDVVRCPHAQLRHQRAQRPLPARRPAHLCSRASRLAGR